MEVHNAKDHKPQEKADLGFMEDRKRTIVTEHDLDHQSGAQQGQCIGGSLGVRQPSTLPQGE